MSQPENDIHRVASDLAQQLKAEIAQDAKELSTSLREEAKKAFLSNRAQLVAELSEATAAEIKKNVLEKYTAQNKIEARSETFIYRTRWAMMPAYLAVGIALAFVALYIIGDAISIAFEVTRIFAKFADLQWLLDVLPAPKPEKFDLPVLVLKILDNLMLASLIVMVLIGGYENTISRIERDNQSGPTWVGTLDLNKLKTKVAASIVLISSIHLLKIFVGIDVNRPQENWNIFWFIIIHVVFILSALGLALIDKMSPKKSGEA